MHGPRLRRQNQAVQEQKHEPPPPPSPSSPPLPRKCTFGCPVLDSLVNGGIPCGSITEIVGECGAGKTQICLQLLVSSQISPSNGGLGASSVYIFTESYFPSRRLQQIAKGFVSAGLGLTTSDKEGKIASGLDPCDNIFVQSIETVEELWEYLEHLRVLLDCAPPMPIKLLIIDSIAALFRSDFDNNATELARRMEWFFKISSKLKQYAHQYDIAILVTNQVVDHFEQEEEAKASESHNSLNSMLSSSCAPLVTEGRKVIPALGIGWSHCVNTRLFISRAEEVVIDHTSSILQHLESELPDDLLLSLSHESSHDNEKTMVVPPSRDYESHCRTRVRRMLHVVFAPNLPSRTCEFVVETSQVRGIKAATFTN